MKKITDVELMNKCMLDAIGIVGDEDTRKAITIELFRYRISGKKNGVLTRHEEFLKELCQKWELSMDEAEIVSNTIDGFPIDGEIIAINKKKRLIYAKGAEFPFSWTL